ncbi:MAG: queuosine precursor transporter [Halobacteriales archaeon]|nr:queuosine precursor transporter [Halobacteriales archaeon]
MRDPVRVGLIGLFVTALVTAQLIAVKVIAIPLPRPLPVVGTAIVAPAGVLAYAVTFFATDCYSELFGQRPAHVVVNVGFVMNLVMLALLWLAIVAPGTEAGVDPSAFAQVLSPSTNIVLGSLLAFVISQNWDVFVFHAIRKQTGPQWLWLRNIVSTATSQGIDTVIFIVVAFYAAPVLLGLGQALPRAVLVQLIVGQYLLKLLIAILDTPFVYAIVTVFRSRDSVRPSAAFD